MALCVGQMGMKLPDFYDATLREIAAVHRGFLDLEKSRDTANWVRDRHFAAILLQPHSKRKVRPQDLAALDIDEPEKPVVSDEQRKRLFDMLMQADDRNLKPVTANEKWH